MMEKVLKFFKSKAIGYYLACGAAFLTFVLMIVFFATKGTSMPNSAAGKGPDTIGIFLVASLIVQIAFLVAPAYGIIEFAALILLGCSFYKELLCCPTVLAYIVNGVGYEGGSLPAHLTYIIMYFVIYGVAIAGAFVGYFKKPEDSAEDMKFVAEKKPNLPVIIKASSIVCVTIVAVLVSTLVSRSVMKDLEGKTDTTDQESEDVKPSPITDAIKSVVDAYEYDFDPSDVHFTRDDLTQDDGKFDFDSQDSEVPSLPTNGQREDKHLIYKFEGSYAEGWQGDYTKTYAYLYLWEDGLFAGTSGSTQFRGYWYDSDEKEDGNQLVMVTSNNANGEIIAYEQKGFYSWIVDLDSSVNQGRRIKAAGYMYYPEAALFIDTGETDLSKIGVGSKVDTSFWTAQRVLKNEEYSYSACFEDNSHKVAWKVNGKDIANNTIDVTEAGTYEVTAKWGELEAKVSFTVA